MSEFHAHGKLLLTGEYVVLDGAAAIGLPTKLGQKLKISDYSVPNLVEWKAFLPNNELWICAKIETIGFTLIEASEEKTAKVLAEILKVVSEMSAASIYKKSFYIETELEFPLNWGLGSSSTLIALLSKVFNINAYELLEKTFGGSGYDISCALMPRVQTYQLTSKERKIQFISLHQNITSHLYFVYLNQKQNSREGIRRYRSLPKNERLIKSISDISKQITECDNLYDFEDLIHVHEHLLANHLGLTPVQQQLFADYSGGEIKSLGAWGGDFVLVTSNDADLSYFNEKGFPVVISYENLIV
ncbi:MAG: GYDIA family GHMP kinase [Flavobacteriaceae bacterium]|nr:GYDIA family GHMP kinase [Flavobacteriaceae bacterium]